MPEEYKPDGESPSIVPDASAYQEDHHSSVGTAPDQPGAGNLPAVTGGSPPSGSSTKPADDEDDDDDGMLRMSFLEHLEELRSRLLKCLGGLGIAFLLALFFAPQMWILVQQPAEVALRDLGFAPRLIQQSPIDGFMTIYVKLPLLASIFLASPWILWQVWSFVAPGLYQRERRFAGPFVLTSAGLFISGGLFAYFVAFRFGLKFLLGVGKDIKVEPLISIVEYLDLFINVTLGVGIVFEIPILIFFLIMLRLTTPQFLIANSRYAILGIVVIAAVVTPTPDVVNLMIFSLPMILLYFVGIFAGWILTLKRDGKNFPWGKLLLFVGLPLLLTGGITVWLMIAKFGYRLISQWPFLIK
jgi:sec-independent protein translocase protein TatC